MARGYVPDVDIRLEAVTAAAANMPGDVICLQEVWTKEDIDYVVANLWSKWHDVYYSYEQEDISSEAPCNDDDLYKLKEIGQCAREKCADAEIGDACIRSQCADLIPQVRGSCRNCAIANAPDNKGNPL